MISYVFPINISIDQHFLRDEIILNNLDYKYSCYSISNHMIKNQPPGVGYHLSVRLPPSCEAKVCLWYQDHYVVTNKNEHQLQLSFRIADLSNRDPVARQDMLIQCVQNY